MMKECSGARGSEAPEFLNMVQMVLNKNAVIGSPLYFSLKQEKHPSNKVMWPIISSARDTGRSDLPRSQQRPGRGSMSTHKKISEPHFVSTSFIWKFLPVGLLPQIGQMKSALGSISGIVIFRVLNELVLRLLDDLAEITVITTVRPLLKRAIVRTQTS